MAPVRERMTLAMTLAMTALVMASLVGGAAASNRTRRQMGSGKISNSYYSECRHACFVVLGHWLIRSSAFYRSFLPNGVPAHLLRSLN